MRGEGVEYVHSWDEDAVEEGEDGD